MTTFLRALFLLALLALPAAAQVADYSTVKMRTVDSGLGFTVSIPDPWVVGAPVGNNKFRAGSGQDDFALIVTDFGPVAKDASEGEAIYRESLERSGFVFKSSTDATVSGISVRRYVFAIASQASEGYLEMLMVPVGGEMYSVMVVTSAKDLAARRQTIDKILASVQITK